MEFTVKIQEILSRSVTVTAVSQADALDIVRREYRQEKHVLGCEDFQNVDFLPKEDILCT